VRVVTVVNVNGDLNLVHYFYDYFRGDFDTIIMFPVA